MISTTPALTDLPVSNDFHHSSINWLADIATMTSTTPALTDLPVSNDFHHSSINCLPMYKDFQPWGFNWLAHNYSYNDFKV